MSHFGYYAIIYDETRLFVVNTVSISNMHNSPTRTERVTFGILTLLSPVLLGNENLPRRVPGPK